MSVAMVVGLLLGHQLVLPKAALAASAPEYLLDGVSFRYFYQSGWGLKMSFGAGRVSYEWIAGPPQGTGKVGVPYRSRKVGPRQYLVAFRDIDRKGGDFVTLLLDFGDNTMAGAALLGYGTDRERVHFEGGTIEGVRWERASPPAR